MKMENLKHLNYTNENIETEYLKHTRYNYIYNIIDM